MPTGNAPAPRSSGQPAFSAAVAAGPETSIPTCRCDTSTNECGRPSITRSSAAASITTAKPLIASPPNRTSARSDRPDEIEVITVRDMVELIDRLSNSSVGIAL